MNNFLKSTGCILLCTLLSGCPLDLDGGGSKDDAVEQGPKVVAGGSEPTLEGVWKSDCISVSDSYSYTFLNVYSGQAFETYLRGYADDNCATPYSRVEIKGSFSTDNQRTLESGKEVTPMALQVDSMHFAYYRSLEVVTANLTNACGISTWYAGELQNISACDDYMQQFAQLKDIVHLTEGEMHVGNSKNIGEDGYPIALTSNALRYQTPVAFEGKWQQACNVTDDGLSSITRELTVFRNFMKASNVVFGDSVCENQVYESQFSVLLDATSEAIFASGESVSLFTFSGYSRNFSFLDEEYVNQFNGDANYACGGTPWLLNHNKDVFECSSFSGLPTSKDAFKIDGDNLIFGDTDYLDDQGYPTQLQAVFYTRQ
mgnify:FL=1